MLRRDVTFERFTDTHLDGAVALSAAAGWAHRREDWDMLMPFSRGIAAISNDQVVGTAFRADFGDALSTINMIIVDRSMRSRGLGRALVSAAMDGTNRCLRLVATPQGKPLYEKLGFEAVSRVSCLQGILTGSLAVSGVQDATFDDIPALTEIESASFGGDRSAAIAWLARTARLAVIRRDGTVVGFAACRRFGDGHVIGPVVAPDADIGLALISYLAKNLVGGLVRLDITDTSGLHTGLEDLGLTVQYHAPIMQRGDVLAASDRLALVSQALA